MDKETKARIHLESKKSELDECANRQTSHYLAGYVEAVRYCISNRLDEKTMNEKKKSIEYTNNALGGQNSHFIGYIDGLNYCLDIKE